MEKLRYPKFIIPTKVICGSKVQSTIGDNFHSQNWLFEKRINVKRRNLLKSSSNGTRADLIDCLRVAVQSLKYFDGLMGRMSNIHINDYAIRVHPNGFAVLEIEPYIFKYVYILY